MKQRSLLITLALIFTFVITAAAKPPVNIDKKGVAIEGYDPVAYFTMSKPVKGSPAFTHEWDGATWQFSNAEHRDLFKANPQKYAPQYGGYCAYGVSKGHKADILPANWSIVDGKLYLNHRFAKRPFDKDVPGNIKKADENWPTVIKE